MSLTSYEKFLIAFQADGSYPSGWSNVESKGSIRGHCRTRFQFAKDRKVQRLKEICLEANLQLDSHEEEKRFNILHQGTHYVNVPITNVLSKNFSDWVFPETRSSEWCQSFIEEVSYWDATRRSDNRFKYDTTVKENADIIQRCCVLAGYGCKISKFKDNRKDVFNDVYSCTILKNNDIDGQSIKKEIVQYSGKIYCVAVPTGKLIVRRNLKTLVCGNSGDPVDIICGDTDRSLYDGGLNENSPQYKGAIEVLWDIFGGTINSKGYKVLNPKIGLIYGDSITPQRAHEILLRLKRKGFASSNVVFGVGSYTYTYVTRDTYGFAVKATAGVVNGEYRPIFKDPKTDSGTKKSLRGFFRVNKNENGTFWVEDNLEKEPNELGDEMHVVFQNGLLFNTDFASIRKRVDESLTK